MEVGGNPHSTSPGVMTVVPLSRPDPERNTATGSLAPSFDHRSLGPLPDRPVDADVPRPFVSAPHILRSRGGQADSQSLRPMAGGALTVNESLQSRCRRLPPLHLR